MKEIVRYIPDVEHQELLFIEDVEDEMTPAQFETFMHLYKSKRMKPQNYLLFTILGFFVVAGIQRFTTKQIGMGLLFVFTGGLCLIGTIYDLLHYKEQVMDYNLDQLEEVVSLVKNNRLDKGSDL